MRVPLCISLSILLALVIVTPVLASDGVREINQACAATGCFPGDAANFPVTITERGSYVLTGNIDVGTFATSAIRVDVDDVTIDLNGFTVRFTFAGGPAAHGIDAAGRSRTRIHNGRVRGFAGDCVNAGVFTMLDTVHASSCGGDGINVDEYSTVVNVVSFGNGGDGVETSITSVITGSIAQQNGASGIRTSLSTVSGNSVGGNSVGGIYASGSSTISDNTVTFNTGDGIETNAESVVRGNTVVGNTGYGLRMSGGSGYRENTISGNSGGTVTGGSDAGANVIGGIVSPTP